MEKSVNMVTNFKVSSKLEEVFLDPNSLFDRLVAIGKNLLKSKFRLFPAGSAKSTIEVHSPDKPKAC